VRAAPRTHIFFFADVYDESRPTSDPLVRQALAFAIDREEIAEAAMSGMGQPAHTKLNPQVFGHVDTEFFPFDPEKAQTLLTEAGYPNGEGFPKLDLVSMSSGISPELSAVVQEQWKEVLGVETELIVLERALYTERRKAHDFGILKLSVAREFPEPSIYPYHTSDGIPYPNVAMYTGIDDLVAELKPEPDLERRAELWAQIQEKMAEDVPIIPVVYPALVLATQKHVEPFEPAIWHYPVWQMKVTE
jgi:ABC-type transport system substrate-binding protein